MDTFELDRKLENLDSLKDIVDRLIESQQDSIKSSTYGFENEIR